MKSFIQIAALLAAAWTATAVVAPCGLSEDSMECDGRSLAAVPAGMWSEIRLLYLNNNSISELYDRSFTGFPNVEYIRLTHNRLSSLELDVFAALPKLINIYLDYNQIHNIEPVSSGLGLNNMAMIFMSYNQISSLDPDVLLGAPKLRHFQLMGNPYVVPGSAPILNHPNLKGLDLRETQAQALSAASLAGLPQLQTLLLQDAGVANVSGAFVRTPLQTVNLQFNAGLTEVRAGSFYPEEVLASLNLRFTGLEKLEVSALNGALRAGGSVDIRNTPLACACAYEGLHWWAAAKGVALLAGCGLPACEFAR